jgi:hypothetical protein
MWDGTGTPLDPDVDLGDPNAIEDRDPKMAYVTPNNNSGSQICERLVKPVQLLSKCTCICNCFDPKL